MKQILKHLLHLLLGEYSVYRIYTRRTADAPPPRSGKSACFTVRELTATELLASPDRLIRDQAGYLGDESYPFACFDGERIVGVCFYWFGARYKRRNFWPLAERQAKLVQVITLPEMRGREVAPTLIALSTHAMSDKGFEHNFARIWHSNTSSLRAFARAGWSYVSTVVEINPLRQRRSLRIRLW
jgi:RimJ/RimL family protein N-acetyltransferase